MSKFTSVNNGTPDFAAIGCLHEYLKTHIDFHSPGEDFQEQYLTSLSLHDYISSYFHLYSENTLRGIISQALKYRQDQSSSNNSNKDVLGHWGDIIDQMKIVLQEKRELASKHFQTLIQYGLQNELQQVNKFLQLLYCQGYLDHLFIDVLQEAMKTFQQQQHEDHYYMMIYFQNTIDDMKQEQAANQRWTICSPFIRKCKLLLAKSPSQQPPQSSLSASDAATTATKSTVVNAKNDASVTKVTEDIAKVSLDPVGDKVAAQPEMDLNEEEVKELMIASDLLNNTVKECPGDVMKLQQRLYQDLFVHKKVKFVAFKRALQDNIDACEAAGYVNKLKLFKFLQDYLIKQAETFFPSSNNSTNENDHNRPNIDDVESTSFMSTHHAPQFVDDRNAPLEGGRVRAAPEVMTFQSFLDAEKIGILDKPKNNKKKAEKKAAKLKTQSLAEQVSDHLNEHGWAVVDNFIPLDVIRRLRIEFNLFRDHFEQSEIWVGKKADVGAHLRVPSVRGDKVLWMCGGHQLVGNDLDEEGEDGAVIAARKGSRMAPEGMSRVIKTHGEIEPCKLEVKAASPMRKFTALKDVITATDKLVEELKGKNGKCKGIYERSDAMLAVYPGEGARFANHIDNTTQDGRRLTLLIYLNPGWTEEMGGALRVTESLQSAIEHQNSEQSNSTDTRVGELSTTAAELPKQRAVDIYPFAGRLAMFYSSEIPHEVMPTYGDRFSMTVWYYDREERKQAIVRARESGTAAQISRTSVESQQGAKAFIADLMGGDEIGVDGGEPTQKELDTLAAKVVNLSDEALDIVANITGAPSVQSFRQGFPMLTVQDLKSMRALFRRMGLQG